MNTEQDFYQAANSSHTWYKFKYRCKLCGIWIRKEDAVFIFLTKITKYNPKAKLVKSKCPRCPECHSKLKTRPCVRKAGREELEKELVRY